MIRDKCIKDWRFVEQLNDELKSFDYGSGYPGDLFLNLFLICSKITLLILVFVSPIKPTSGDPKTKEFLRLSLDKIFGFPSFIRFGWSTAYTILDKEAIQCNFEEDEDNEDENTPSVMGFFKKQIPQLKSSKFFIKNNLKRVENFN